MSVRSPAGLYENDFYAWTQLQAKELRRFARTRPNLPLDLVHLALSRMADVQQRPRVVLADRGYDGHAGQLEEQGERKRALVGRGQDDRLVEAEGSELLDESQCRLSAHRLRLGIDPGSLVDDDPVDAGKQPGGGCAPRTAQQRDPFGAGGPGLGSGGVGRLRAAVRVHQLAW